MIGIDVKSPGAPAELLSKLGRNADKALALAIYRCAQRAEAEIKETIQSLFNPGTGNLMRSFKSVMLSKSSAGAMSDSVYAGIQNEGGPITPRIMKNLAIPIEDAGLAIGQWPRHFPKEGRGSLRFIPSKDPDVTGILVKRLSKGASDQDPIQYVLKKKVEITGKKYLEEASKKADPHYPRIISERLQELIVESEKAALKTGK